MTNNDIERPLYTIEDEEEETVLDPEQEQEEESQADKRPVPLAILLKIMFNPVEGWKSLKRARFKTDEVAARCFYPLIALAALADASMFIYEANMTAADWAKEGLVTFISFFFGYFSIFFVGSVLMPKKSRGALKTEIGKQFVMIAMSTLAIFQTLIELLPMLDPVLVFLPLWTIYLIYKGIRLLRVPKEVETASVGILCTLTIGLPLLWSWIMSEVLLPLTL